MWIGKGRRKLVEPALVGAFVATVCTVSALSREGLISIGTVAASPRRIADGQVWLLFSSAIVVDRPLVASVVSVAVLALAWMLRGDLTALDSEHVFAFALGAAVAGRSVLGTVRSPRIAMRPSQAS